MEKKERGIEDFGCELKPKPVIERLEEALKQDLVVCLEGYVGSSDCDTLRLYKDLSLENYVEVPKKEIIDCVESPNDNFGYVKVFIPASVNVQTWSQSHTPASALRTATDDVYVTNECCYKLRAYINDHLEDCPPNLMNFYWEHCK